MSQTKLQALIDAVNAGNPVISDRVLGLGGLN